MADDATVIFGAQIDKLLEGVEKSNEAIRSMAEAANKTGEAFKRMGEVFGIALSIEGIKEFIESMTELGLATERAEAMLGASSQQIQVLSGIAKLTGGSLEGMVMSINRLHLGMQRATADGFAPQAQAAKALGINIQEFLKLPADKYFEALNAAVSKFNPSMNLSNALMQLGGRGVTQMLPALLLSTEKYKELEAAIRASAVDFAHFAPAAAETHQKLTLLGMAMTGLGERIFMVIKPAIDAAADALRKWVQGIDAQTIAGVVSKIGDAVLTVLQVIGHMVIQIKEWLDGLGSTADSLKERMKNAAKGAGVGAAVTPFGIGAGPGAVIGFVTGGTDDGAAKAAAESRAKFDAQILEWQKSWAKMKLTMEMGAAAVHEAEGHKLDAPQIQEGARMAVEAQVERIEQEIALAKGLFAQKKAIYDMEASAFQITEQTKIKLTRDAANEEYAAELGALQRIQALWRGHPKEWEAVQKQIVAVQQQHALEMIKLNAEAIKEMQATFHEWMSGISSAFTGQIRGLLQGTTTWRQAFKSAVLDMTMFFIQQVERMVVKWAAGQLAMLFATQDRVAAQTAAEATGSAASSAIVFGDIIKKILASAWQTFAGIFGFLSPEMGPAAAGPAAAGLGVVMGAAGKVPQYEVGTPFVPFTGLAVLHRGERVVTAEDNARGFGSPQVSVNISAWDGRSVQSWLQSGGSRILAKALADHMMNNPTSRGRY